MRTNEIHQASSESNNFFIIGLPRSGTTMLEQMLDAHSLIAVCPEIASGMAFSRFGAKDNIKDHQHELLILNNFDQWSRGFNDPINKCLSMLAIAPNEFPIPTKRYYERLTELYLKQKNATLFGEKTPENLFYLRTLKQTLPNSKYIFIQRNPLDVVLSMCENVSMIFKQDLDLKMIKRFAPIVKKGLKELYVINRMEGEEQHWLLYENLVEQPENNLRSICQFLGVQFDDAMLDFQFRKKFTDANSNHQKIHQRLNEPITRARINRYKTEFTSEQIDYLIAYLSPEIFLSPYRYEKQLKQLPPMVYVQLILSKILFSMGFYEFKELMKQLKSKLFYHLIVFFKGTKIESFLTKNLKWKKESWDYVPKVENQV
ncbi:MAG: sulfotransferase [Saprospiraceae bacterium]|nr:sulfotransferase [Saprospiraceae bacterium]